MTCRCSIDRLICPDVPLSSLRDTLADRLHLKVLVLDPPLQIPFALLMLSDSLLKFVDIRQQVLDLISTDFCVDVRLSVHQSESFVLKSQNQNETEIIRKLMLTKS